MRDFRAPGNSIYLPNLEFLFTNKTVFKIANSQFLVTQRCLGQFFIVSKFTTFRVKNYGCQWTDSPPPKKKKKFKKNLKKIIIFFKPSQKTYNKCTLIYHKWLERISHSRTFVLSDLSNLFTVAQCSFGLSDLSESLTVAHLIWAIWENEGMSDEQISNPENEFLVCSDTVQI